MEIRKIVITGGPCAGKTTAMSWIMNEFTRMGWCVLFVPETATELISGGVAPWTCGTNLEYQKCQVTLQLAKEKIFEQAAATMGKDKVLIVCDRGFMDNKAYMNDEEFQAVLDYVNYGEFEIRNSYDAVFHLVTAADGAAEYYTTANNAARYETAEQAVQMDRKLMSAWRAHPHFCVIDNSTDFEMKMQRLINSISHYLGENESVFLKRKFLVRIGDKETLQKDLSARVVDMIHVYLKTAKQEEYHIRQWNENGHFTANETVKKRIGNLKSIEVERRITENMYLELLEQADEKFHPLHKKRYYFSSDDQYFVLDVYPFWKDQAILIREVESEESPIILPARLELIKEVTGVEEYDSYHLAARYDSSKYM